MNVIGVNPSRFGLEDQGLGRVGTAWWNLGTAVLLERALQAKEGMVSGRGALVVRTGQFTGRTPGRNRPWRGAA